MTGQQNIIDILMVMDADTLVEKHAGGSVSNPIVIPEPLIYLICNSAYVDFGQASKELKIAVKSLDEIRWRSTSISLGSAYFSLLYAFKLVKGDNIISAPVALEAEVKEPLPDPANPTKPKTQTVQNYFWSSTALSQGEATYTFYFMILDREGNPLGYYYWDPFIKITE
ncbi:MAG: inclusion body family protein [Anaerolineaceae bacterium]|nr:inclusion body family protein [Anaerolineaceae bacterium]